MITAEEASFNTQPPEGGWAVRDKAMMAVVCFNTQPPEGGWTVPKKGGGLLQGFNTQPPEGGWARAYLQQIADTLFQHTAARRRLARRVGRDPLFIWFQHTAARRRLVSRQYSQPRQQRFQHTAARRRLEIIGCAVCLFGRFNTQPPEGGWPMGIERVPFVQGFNTQPPEGGWMPKAISKAVSQGFNTQPPEGGWVGLSASELNRLEFQHTAARRRLAGDANSATKSIVSTHSRPKAAGTDCFGLVFLTQFQHTAARRRLDL